MLDGLTDKVEVKASKIVVRETVNVGNYENISIELTFDIPPCNKEVLLQIGKDAYTELVATTDAILEERKARNVSETNPQPQTEEKPKYSPSEIANPVATSLMDLITAKQLGMIRAIARQIGINVEEECVDKFSCKTDELSKKAASAFIQHLQDIEKETTSIF